MSMIGNLKRISELELAALHRDPNSIEAVLGYPTDDDDDNEVEPDWFDADKNPNGNSMCLDKCWHALHFLLTQTAWGGEPPWNFLIAGDAVGDIDVGYGPARSHSPAAVQKIAAALWLVTDETLRARFKPAEMQADIYPSIWDRAEYMDEKRQSLLSYFVDLTKFVAAAAVSGQALLIWVN